jgi:hypothetical protein
MAQCMWALAWPFKPELSHQTRSLLQQAKQQVTLKNPHEIEQLQNSQRKQRKNTKSQTKLNCCQHFFGEKAPEQTPTPQPPQLKR